MKRRRISYSGESKDQSLLIGNYGDVQFVAEGKFDLSGLIYCPRYTVEFIVAGQGAITFRGVCKKLIIKNVSGDCVLDLSEVVCKEVQCKLAKGNSLVTVGPTKVISLANLQEDAVLQYKGKPLITNCLLANSARMEPLDKKMKKILVAA